MNWAVLLGLLACNAIWAFTPIMGKVLLHSYAPFQLAQIRYGAAFVTALIITLALRLLRSPRLTPLPAIRSWENFQWIVLGGLVTFFGSPILQYLGLIRGTATANSLVVAIEPLFAVLLAGLFLHERLTLRQKGSFTLALLGFLLLSNVKPHSLSETFSLFSVGNLFFLAVMPCEATYTIISRKLAGRVSPVSIFTACLAVGFFVLSSYLWFTGESLPSVAPLAEPRNLAALLLVGPIGTTITYIFWSEALVTVPVAAVVLTLLGQPVLGALAGIFFLGEKMDLWQALGAAMILAALAIQSIPAKKEGMHETPSNR